MKSIVAEDGKKQRLWNKKIFLIGLMSLSIIILAGVIINYRWMFYEINIFNARGAKSLDKKIQYCTVAINYKAGNEGVKLFTELVENEMNADPVKAQGQVLLVKGKINNDKFRSLMVQVLLKKADSYGESNLKAAINSLLEAKSYGYNLSGDKSFKMLLNEYAQQSLGENDIDGFKVVSLDSGDVDNDGNYEVVLGEMPSVSADASEYYGYGRVSVYRYDGNKFNFIDKTDVFADSSINVTIAKASKEVWGIFAECGVGAHSGSTQLILLKNNRLTYPVNNLGVYSLYPVKISDIDNDGVMEIGSMDINPQSKDKTNAGSDKIIIYYRWNGASGFNIAKKVYVKGGTNQ